LNRRRLARLSRQGALSALLGPALRLAIKRYELPLDGLFSPVRLVIVSDLHFGWARIDAAFCERLRRRVAGLGPSAVLFLGDLAGGWKGARKHARVDAGAAALRGYAAPLGCFAIMGNHEWRDDAPSRARGQGPNRAEALLRAAGWTVLANEARPFCGIWLAGIDSQRAFGRHGADDLGRALRDLPEGAPVVLLAHEPDIFPDLPDQVRLTLSGHTHAGQIRPFGRPLHVPSRHGTRFAYGHHQIGARHLIVSGGLGCSGVPIRYGIPPEITVVELRPA
jgi:predicted MPP superfamily phosphohydrolase